LKVRVRQHGNSRGEAGVDRTDLAFIHRKGLSAERDERTTPGTVRTERRRPSSICTKAYPGNSARSSSLRRSFQRRTLRNIGTKQRTPRPSNCPMTFFSCRGQTVTAYQCESVLGGLNWDTYVPACSPRGSFRIDRTSDVSGCSSAISVTSLHRHNFNNTN
jgi:hypothetical protein